MKNRINFIGGRRFKRQEEKLLAILASCPVSLVVRGENISANARVYPVMNIRSRTAINDNLLVPAIKGDFLELYPVEKVETASLTGNGILSISRLWVPDGRKATLIDYADRQPELRFRARLAEYEIEYRFYLGTKNVSVRGDIIASGNR